MNTIITLALMVASVGVLFLWWALYYSGNLRKIRGWIAALLSLAILFGLFITAPYSQPKNFVLDMYAAKTQFWCETCGTQEPMDVFSVENHLQDIHNMDVKGLFRLEPRDPEPGYRLESVESYMWNTNGTYRVRIKQLMAYKEIEL